ncbi:MAG: RagB/SusD family nutrient uptake outer membrane protein [Tannerella sp.]|jgi:hypothetical protein|nr:RagB/SusD family nutrient uptake outer membrane protein [Tannerella sp.]
MKAIYQKTGIAVIMALFAVSCDESKFLEEKPLSIYAAEIALETSTDYQAAVNYLYRSTTDLLFYRGSGDNRVSMWYGTDLAFCSCDVNKLNKYADTMIPTYFVVEDTWRNTYVIVNQANLILSRIETSGLPEAEKNTIRGEALFFRAFGYRILANLFGGVPLIMEEITAPRRDFVRASRQDTYTQVKNDLLEAIPLLANIESVKDGKVSRQVAQHLLAETYVSLGDYNNAISMATSVIDYPGVALMTARFGTKANETGSAYSDLHRSGNQNRSSGNRESLWASQFDHLNPASPNSSLMPRDILPNYLNITITADEVTTTAFVNGTAEKGGATQGWMQPTDYACNGVWDDSGDLRNADYLIIRDWRIDNEDSPAFGKWIVKDGFISQINPVRQFYPFFMKVAGDIPEELYLKDANGSPLLTALGEHCVPYDILRNYRESYIFRLAETYLLRAEAHILNGNQAAAAADINVIRARSEASLVEPSQVDIDYLLDERIRELCFEELRMITLCRMGKLVERTRKYNSTYPAINGQLLESSGTSMKDYHNLWPIPFSEIERNIEAKLEQNPGYTN